MDARRILKNHIDYLGHVIDITSVITGENKVVTVYKVDFQYACLSLIEAKQCIEELIKNE